MVCFELDQKAVAYAATTFGTSFMCSAFDFYYVKIFLNHYKVTEGWFQASQVAYMIWNTLNDPLFGYMQDNLDYSWAKRRRHAILHGAPLFGITFMVAWFPWSSPSTDLSGLHLMITLFFFDGVFTFVHLAHCSLFAELSREHNDRVRLVKYSQYAGLLGSTSVFFCGYFSKNLENFQNFQITCTIIAVISIGCMVYTGLRAETVYDKENIPISNLEPEENKDSLRYSLISGLNNGCTQIWQVIKDRDFLSFALVNLLQRYHAVFLSGFTMIICDQLISKDTLPSAARSLFYGSLPVAPKITTILLVPILRSKGYYRVIIASLVIKIFLGFIFLMLGPRPYYLMGYFFLDSVCCHFPLSFTYLVLSDVIDKDKDLYKRRHPLSSMVFAANALVTCPAVSLAPMITVAILNQYGYELVKSSKMVEPLVLSQLHEVMFHLICFTSIGLGVLQLILWSKYQIRNSHKDTSKFVEGDL